MKVSAAKRFRASPDVSNRSPAQRAADQKRSDDAAAQRKRNVERKNAQRRAKAAPLWFD